jgi:hypothetical protein
MSRKIVADRSKQTEAQIAEEAYVQAMLQAKRLLDQGFHLGGVIPASRDEWHER